MTAQRGRGRPAIGDHGHATGDRTQEPLTIAYDRGQWVVNRPDWEHYGISPVRTANRRSLAARVHRWTLLPVDKCAALLDSARAYRRPVDVYQASDLFRAVAEPIGQLPLFA